MTCPRPLVLVCAVLASIGSAGSAQQAKPEAVPELVRRAEARLQSLDLAGAAALWEQVVELNPHVTSFWQALATTRMSTREYGKAILAFEKALELGAGTPMYNVAYEIARAHGLLGEREPTLAWLARALETGFRSRARMLGDEAFAFLREDAAFRELARPVDPARLSRAEGWRHDLELLELEVARMHHDPFEKITRDAFEGEVRRLSAEAGDLTDNQIVVRLMALMSRIGDGHTNCAPEFVRDWTHSVPLQFSLFQEGLFVISAPHANAELVGAQVLRVGDHPWEHVLAELGRIISLDNSQGILRAAPAYLRFPQVLNGLGLQPESDRLALTIRGADGESRTVSVAVTPTDPAFNRFLGHPEWVTAHEGSPGPTPLYLKDRRTPYWFELLPDGKTLYFQFNLVINAPEPLDRFVARLFEFIDENEVERLIIDMRWNNGGNTLLLPPLVRELSRDRSVTRRGNLFVIVGRYTFSAAMNAATYIEHHTDATFVGEPTPSSPNYVGESNILPLPCSRVHVSISDIFWQSAWPFDRRTWIAPLIYTPPSFDAYRAKRDPALEAILASGAGD